MKATGVARIHIVIESTVLVCVVDEGSRSVSYDSGWVVGGFGATTVDGVDVVGFVGGALWKGKTLCPFGILFP